MALQHHALGVGQRSGLAQDLLGDRELAEVVQARGEAGELDLFLREAEPPRGSGGQVRDPLRVAACVDVARVDRTRQARGGAEAGCAVRAARESLQLGELDHVGPVRTRAILPVFLRPVEGAVGESNQLVAIGGMRRRGRDPDAHRDRAELVELQRRDPVDHGRRRGQRVVLVIAREQKRELVAAEPERLAGLAQSGRKLGEDAVAGRMTEAVVDALEIVDVDEAQRERETPFVGMP